MNETETDEQKEQKNKVVIQETSKTAAIGDWMQNHECRWHGQYVPLWNENGSCLQLPLLLACIIGVYLSDFDGNHERRARSATGEKER